MNKTQKLAWAAENTGGGCMAWAAERDGFRYMITTHDDPSLPDPVERADLGIYAMGDEDESVYFGVYVNSNAAAFYAEAWKPATLRQWLLNERSDPSRSRWLTAFADYAQGPNALLDCPLHSVCGKLIRKLIVAGDDLLALVGEREQRDRIVTAIRAECCVVYFG
jgi:alkanesulfonate monooxygenase SsuD/methylene tetrahydromethanopterin reductase-like flavin-dependent oxidoreductase (luciferase family)